MSLATWIIAFCVADFFLSVFVIGAIMRSEVLKRSKFLVRWGFKLSQGMESALVLASMFIVQNEWPKSLLLLVLAFVVTRTLTMAMVIAFHFERKLWA